VFDYLGADATVVLHGDLEPAFQRFWQDTKDRYRLVHGDPERPVLPPDSLFLSTEQFYARANEHAQLSVRPANADRAEQEHSAFAQKLGDLSVVRGAEDPLSRLQGHIRNTAQRVLLLAESDGRRESLLDFLRASGVSPPAFDSLLEFQTSSEKLGIATAALSTGFSWLEDGIDFVTETELFAASPTTRRRKKQEQVSDVDALIKDLSELNLGDPVVHIAHGIGRYRGLVNLDMGEKNADGTPALMEFLHLEYADKAVLYVAWVPTRRPCTAWAAASGKRPSARPPSRCAMPRPSCSTSTPGALRARATPSATRRRTMRCSRTTSASRKPPTSAPPSMR